MSPSPSEGTPPGNITGSVRDEFGNGISSVAVRRYADANGDGVPDGGVLQTVFTTGSGTWSMVSLVPGNYIVEVATIPNYTIVSGIDITDDGDVVPNVPTTDNQITVTVESGEIDSGNNFVFTPDDGTISGTVLDNLAAPIADAVINIYEDDDLDGVAGTLVTSGTTNASGVYSISGLQAGPSGLAAGDKSYVIELVVPALYQMVSGIDNTDDGDLVPNTDTTNNIIPCSLSAGEVDANNDFIIELI